MIPFPSGGRPAKGPRARHFNASADTASEGNGGLGLPHERWVEPGIRVIVNAPERMEPGQPTRLVVFATPNGNTIEQTLGSALAPGTDWHFDIQHVAAQVRRLREVTPGENVVLAVVEAEGLSWPAWRNAHGAAGDAVLRRLVEGLRDEAQAARVSLAGHSGGGSFLFGFLRAGETMPDYVDRLAFLDANYAYSDGPGEHDGDRLLSWLRGDPARHLAVIAYDDREITLDGKKVVGPDGGTFRATARMLARLSGPLKLAESKAGDVTTRRAPNGQALFRVHANPQNKILHTALVGEMNCLLDALTFGTPQAEAWGTFGGPRAYTKWVQPAAGIPPRPADAPGGSAFFARITALTPAEREEAIAAELLRGNLPDFLRRFVTVTATITDAAGKVHTATYEVMLDYLAVGSDDDWVRVPMTPMTAQRVADAFGCSLPTRKMADDIYRQAAVKLEPAPLTEAREATATFLWHHDIIEAQRLKAGGKPGQLTAGVKKDVVVTNRLAEKPNRVAIYGWHKPDGAPVQPLAIVHRDTYVDYSHGVRLVRRAVTVDGRMRDLHLALHDAVLHPLLSDEGPVVRPSY